MKEMPKQLAEMCRPGWHLAISGDEVSEWMRVVVLEEMLVEHNSFLIFSISKSPVPGLDDPLNESMC